MNNDPNISDYRKVVVLPNYNIPLGPRVYPVVDFKQIFTTGEEVLGTSSMKFFLNSALSIRTFDDPKNIYSI
ncbi:MAG: glycogen/starch/alpha-glucan phosphorylase [cyanobacterium endosymbiont of Rhopalodia yunnanensis]